MASRPSSRCERPALHGGWTLWPQTLLRGAGFPFALVEEVLRSGPAGLRRLAADPCFREAVTWQNRAAVLHGLDWLLRQSADAADAKTRKKELLVVRYLQRYATKNDTIGFFGPVGWTRWGARGRYAPQGALVDARATFLEPWAARALSEALAESPRLRGSLHAWLPGDLGLRGRWLVTPTESHPLDVATTAWLRRLARTGPVSVRRLVGSSRHARDRLECLRAQGVVRVGLPVAICHEPLARTSTIVGASRDGGAKRALSSITAALRGVAAVRRVPSTGGATTRDVALGAALERLERAFTKVTGSAPSRLAGKAYAGRGLVYEECRRLLDLELSDAMRARVARPLAAVLRVARWYTYSVAKTFLAALEGAVDRLGENVPLHVLWAATQSEFSDEPARCVAPALATLKAELAALWAGRTDVETPEAERFIARRFRAPCPGWPGARHHAPDLLWAAPSAETMLHGEGTPVLGELHPGVNPFSTLSVLAHAPDRPALERQWREDLGEGGVSPIPWEEFARSTQDARLSRSHWHLDLGFDFDSDRPAGRVVRAADFVVRRVAGQLVAVHTRRRLQFHLLEIMERRVKLRAATAFSLADGEATAPRRSLGGLVVQRARWRFERQELAWLEPPVGRLERSAAFCAAHGLPRHVFARCPDEVKPLYVDLQQPLLLEMLARLVRRTPWMSFSEMLPGPSDLWLTDGAGGRYVCELRCLTVDPRPWSAAAFARVREPARPQAPHARSRATPPHG